MKLVSFSNKRPVQAEQGSFLTVSQTTGKIRITGKVGEMIEVMEGDYLAVGADMETKKLFIYKGVKEDKLQVGNKLNRAGQNLEFGSQNSWDELGGTTEHSIRYVVSETPIEDDGTKFWELTDKEDLPRSTRTRKTADGKEESVDDDETVEEEEEVAPVIEAESEGFTLD
jgi:hypothetical protein